MHGALKRTDALSGNIFYSKSIVNLSMTANQSEYATIINSLVMAIKSGLFGLLNLGNGPRRKAKEKRKTRQRAEAKCQNPVSDLAHIHLAAPFVLL